MSMVIDMNDEKLKTLEQIKEFMAGTEGEGFTHQPDRTPGTSEPSGPEHSTYISQSLRQIREDF
jgi:hypothetical protein